MPSHNIWNILWLRRRGHAMWKQEMRLFSLMNGWIFRDSTLQTLTQGQPALTCKYHQCWSSQWTDGSSLKSLSSHGPQTHFHRLRLFCVIMTLAHRAEICNTPDIISQLHTQLNVVIAIHIQLCVCREKEERWWSEKNDIHQLQTDSFWSVHVSSGSAKPCVRER